MAVKPENNLAAFAPPRKAEEWNKYVQNSIKAMHQSLSTLYENVEEISDSSASAVSDPSDKTALLDDVPFPAAVEIFVNQSNCLDLLLRTPSKWPVKLPMNSIINVLARCLKVTSANLKSKPSLSELADALPRLHGSALANMTQLIVCCGSNILPKSRVIIDACFRSLVGAKQGKGEAKSIIRGQAFQVLCLMVERFGWGRYLQSLSSSLIQDLISDICSQEAPKTDSSVTMMKPKQEVESIAQRKSKKKKKGKKQKGDSYSDLPVHAADDAGNTPQIELFNLEATQAALELSHLILQRADYSQVQTLVRSLLNTSKSLQREGPAVASPYNSEDCRKGLYSALLSCATVRLGHDCDRKDTISHFQVTNLAMSLLTSAAHSDPSPEIQKSCNEYLMMLRNTGNLNRPIVRRILPDEQISTKDIAEVEREAEKLSEENKGLWKQLVDTQLELEARSREMEQLRQASALKKAVEARGRRESEDNSEPKLVKPSNRDTARSIDDERKESSEDEDEDSNLEEKEKDPEKKIESISAAKQAEEEISHPCALSSTILSSKENTPKQGISPSAPLSAKDKKKRLLNDTEDEARCYKKAKPEDPEPQSDDLEAMLSDFVDTAPDQFQ